jgi:transaldolase
MTTDIESLRIKIFADGADINSMKEMNNNSWIKGLTTNPTLMRKSGITDYKAFSRQVLEFVKTKPVSFEVFSDDLNEMIRQAYEIASWGPNVFVKIPVTNTQGISTASVVKELSDNNVQLNVTAVMTQDQVKEISENINSKIPSFVSIFAGRIADTGVNPTDIISEALTTLSRHKLTEIIWASPRELLNILQADEIGCHVITATNEILGKLSLLGKNLEEYSLETVKMFKKDADIAGFSL